MKLLFIPLLMLAATLSANAHCGSCGTDSKDKAHSHETTVSEAPAKKCCGTDACASGEKKADCGTEACASGEKKADCGTEACAPKEKKACAEGCTKSCCAPMTEGAAAAPKLSCCSAPKADV